MKSRRVIRKGQTSCYHVLSRFCEEVPYLPDEEKEVFRKQLWKTAYSCAVEVLSYAILGNHFHLLVRISDKIEFSDAELLKRYAVLYPKPNKWQKKRVEDYERDLAAGGEAAEAARAFLTRRLGNLSMFMKLFKHRFSIFYNRLRQRKGTLWGERFKSVLIEDSVEALVIVAAYIDLNAVRAGIVKDPADYRFCGYGEVVAGEPRAMEAFQRLFKSTDDNFNLEEYRQILFGKGAMTKAADGRGAVIDHESVKRVMDQGGSLSEYELLLFKERYFSDGCVLGSAEFVAAQIPLLRQLGTTTRKSEKSFAVPAGKGRALRSFRQIR